MVDDLIRRRELLFGLGAASIGGSSFNHAIAQRAEEQPMPGNSALPESPANKTGWAIVGLGSFAIGQVIPGFADAQRSRITAFVSGSPKKASELSERFGVERLYDYDNFDRIIDNPSIDCVYIVLPVGLHAEYTIRALKARKHVLCEKPMASSSQECQAMIAAAKAANRQLGVAYRVHFEPTNVEAHRRIAAGELGSVRYGSADAGFDANPDYPPHKWRLTKSLGGGGSMYDIGIYGLNGALFHLNAEVVEVSAIYAYPSEDPRFREVEGGLSWRALLSNGTVIQGSSSYCYSYVTRHHYQGTGGALSMEPASAYYENELVVSRSNQPKATINTGNAASQFAAQVDGFSEAARSNTQHRTPGEMGLRDIRLIEAMYKSADAGGKIVRVIG